MADSLSPEDFADDPVPSVDEQEVVGEVTKQMKLELYAAQHCDRHACDQLASHVIMGRVKRRSTRTLFGFSQTMYLVLHHRPGCKRNRKTVLEWYPNKESFTTNIERPAGCSPSLGPEASVEVCNSGMALCVSDGNGWSMTFSADGPQDPPVHTWLFKLSVFLRMEREFHETVQELHHSDSKEGSAELPSEPLEPHASGVQMQAVMGTIQEADGEDEAGRGSRAGSRSGVEMSAEARVVGSASSATAGAGKEERKGGDGLEVEHVHTYMEELADGDEAATADSITREDSDAAEGAEVVVVGGDEMAPEQEGTGSTFRRRRSSLFRSFRNVATTPGENGVDVASPREGITSPNSSRGSKTALLRNTLTAVRSLRRAGSYDEHSSYTSSSSSRSSRSAWHKASGNRGKRNMQAQAIHLFHDRLIPIQWQRFAMAFQTLEAARSGDWRTIEHVNTVAPQYLRNNARPLNLFVAAIRARKVDLVQNMLETFPTLHVNSRNSFGIPCFFFAVHPFNWALRQHEVEKEKKREAKAELRKQKRQEAKEAARMESRAKARRARLAAEQAAEEQGLGDPGGRESPKDDEASSTRSSQDGVEEVEEEEEPVRREDQEGKARSVGMDRDRIRWEEDEPPTAAAEEEEEVRASLTGSGEGGTICDGGILKLMVRHGADLSLQTHTGQTFVHWIVQRGRPKFVVSILSYIRKELDADLHTPDSFNATPLHYACFRGEVRSVKFLVQDAMQICCTKKKASRGQPFVPSYRQRARWLPATAMMVDYLQLSAAKRNSVVRQWRKNDLMYDADSASPLGVATLHGQLRVAQFLITYVGNYQSPDAAGQDGDTTCMRLGSLVFDDNNQDFKLISKIYPPLVERVLSSLLISEHEDVVLWGNSKDNNYSLHEDEKDEVDLGIGSHFITLDTTKILGDPTMSARQTPLASLANSGYKNVWNCEAARALLAIKWSQFGRIRFLRDLIPYLTLILLLVLETMVSAVKDGGRGIGSASGILWIMILIVSALILLFEEGLEYRASGAWEYFSDVYNWISCLTYLGLIATAVIQVVDAKERQNEGHKMVAICILLLFLRSLEFLSILKRTSRFVHMLRLMLTDLSQWITVFLILQLSFSMSFYILLRNEDTGGRFNNFWNAGMTTFVFSTGEIALPFIVSSEFNEDTLNYDDDYGKILRDSHKAEIEVEANCILIGLIFLVTICYLNVLIAMMSQSYQTIIESAEAESLQGIAAALVRWESTMSTCWRRYYHAQLRPPKGERWEGHFTLNLRPKRDSNAWIKHDSVTLASKRRWDIAQLQAMMDYHDSAIASAGSASSSTGAPRSSEGQARAVAVPLNPAQTLENASDKTRLLRIETRLDQLAQLIEIIAPPRRRPSSFSSSSESEGASEIFEDDSSVGGEANEEQEGQD
eukprot:CAMPEP_0118969722 /NCGR_PEP_ID=MMETSP1173-20130426/6769_1 /TAXON_ID=1034831 /ORGANISM="Rhizochromulina marina cf, Strain CCMP1243" /LENGTH=1404 /DNA_ID=CAMNT_0006918999 /DNA_START=1 /DNA_END=4215 /DNA_ORIENTATION=-